MIYIISKDVGRILGSFVNIKYAKEYAEKYYDENYITYVEDITMKSISRTMMVDNVVIYNNKTFWLNESLKILDDYNNHTVVDIMGQPISKYRFEMEAHSNIDRLYKIDGRPGQIQYNMEIGQEFISLFREECILTKFTKETDTSPMIIFKKLDTVINMLQIGGFREARQYLQAYRAQIRDDFLTNERIDKYIAMLNSADAIEYATDEDYFYTVPDKQDV